MERDTNEANQVGDQSQTVQKGEKAEPEPSDAQTAQTGEKAESEPTDVQTAQKGEKAEPKPSDTKKLIQFMENNYEQYVANVQSFDEFYHAIVELIEMFCEERGHVMWGRVYSRRPKARGQPALGAKGKGQPALGAETISH